MSVLVGIYDGRTTEGQYSDTGIYCRHISATLCALQNSSPWVASYAPSITTYPRVLKVLKWVPSSQEPNAGEWFKRTLDNSTSVACIYL